MGKMDVCTCPKTIQEQQVMTIIIVFCEDAFRELKKKRKVVTISEVMQTAMLEIQDSGVWLKDWTKDKGKKI